MESTTSRPLHTVGTTLAAEAEEVGRRASPYIMQDREEDMEQRKNIFSLVCVAVLFVMDDQMTALEGHL